MAASESTRPLLLPQNRKLRHLRGIYLRNLTLTRPRGSTIDDTTLNQSTPSKQEALRPSASPPSASPSSPLVLHHSKSSSALRPARPRRVSSHWDAASPALRQKKLEDVVERRTADTFFSLHCAAQTEPVYVSEVVERAMNPTFRFFDLASWGPATTRLDVLVVKVWARTGNDWKLLVEEEIQLHSLQFLGSLENHQFKPNCILFQLVDGIYTLDIASKPPKPKAAPSLPTSSYSALMRLSNLDESIQDALATREEIANQINAVLRDTPKDHSPQAQEDLVLANRYITTQRKALKTSTRRRADLETSLSARRAAMATGREVQARAQEDVAAAQEQLSSCRSLLQETRTQIRGQRRRICEELLHIFPIDPTSTPLLFTICALPLPNTAYDDADEDTLAAALGYVARLVDMLQYYLSVSLPYPVSPHGSRSLIHDHISKLQDNNQRTFPLYTRSVVRFRFDYGVFLLNKNIEALAASQGLKVLDIRQTLPNLKYLLYVCSAGSEDLPARKAGGVRGLLGGSKLNSFAGGMNGTGTGRLGIDSPALSRRGSDESGLGAAADDAARRALEAAASKMSNPAPPVSSKANGIPSSSSISKKPNGANSSSDTRTRTRDDSNESGSEMDDQRLPFRDVAQGKSLRTRGLREGVAAAAGKSGG